MLWVNVDLAKDFKIIKQQSLKLKVCVTQSGMVELNVGITEGIRPIVIKSWDISTSDYNHYLLSPMQVPQLSESAKRGDYS